MNKLLVLALAFNLSACGMISDNCDGDLCESLFGAKNSQQDDTLKNQVIVNEQLQQQIEQLNIQANYLSALMELYQMQLENGLSAAGAKIDALEVTMTNLNIELLDLQDNVQVYSVEDPCGNAPNIFDEVLLNTSMGLLASFSDNSNGKNTRLSIVPNGNYVTTDGSNCNFTVLNGEVL